MLAVTIYIYTPGWREKKWETLLSKAFWYGFRTVTQSSCGQLSVRLEAILISLRARV